MFGYEWRGHFDNAAVNALHAEGFDHRVLDDDWWTQVNRHSLGWVCAKREDDLVGFVNVAWDGAIHAFILDTLVATAVRRRGVGRQLVAHAAGHARAAGCEWPHVDLADHLEPFYLDTCGFRPRKAGLIALRAGRHGRPAMVVTRSGTWRTRMPSTVRDALAALAALLAPGEHDVADRVTSAHDDPEAYLRAHADQLDERGVDEPVPTLAWIALVDALADRDLLAEVDWKEDPREVVDRLRTLRSTPANAGAWIWLEDTDIHVATHDFLELAGTRLREAGTALAVLDIESDCYPLVLLPAGRGRDLVDLATAAGFTADVLGAARS